MISPGRSAGAVECAVRRIHEDGQLVPHEVIVVGMPGDAELSLEEFGEVRRVEAHDGVGVAWNAGMGAANGDPILLLDPDIELCDGSLRALTRISQEDNVGVVGGRILSTKGVLANAGFEFCPQSGFVDRWAGANATYFEALQQGQVAAVDFGAALVSRRAYDAVDGFDESLSSSRFAGIDFCLRARAQSFRIMYCPPCAGVDRRLSGISSADADPAVTLQVIADLDRVYTKWGREEHVGDGVLSMLQEYEKQFDLYCAHRLRDLGVVHLDEILGLIGLG